MSRFNIVKSTPAPKSFREKAICGSFNIQSENLKEVFAGDLETPSEWAIGVIWGNSGTGKSTIAREIYPEAYIRQFEYSKGSVVDNMPEASVSEIEKAFTSVGFASPPSWLKPYSVLSNGEKMRVDLARALLEKRELIVFDEFTSVVDRNVAKVASIALAKAVRAQKKQFIAVTCHEDILEWLEPDWVFCTNDMSYRATRGLLHRPTIQLHIYRCQPDFWRFFKKHHYMSGEIHRSARCFLAVLGKTPAGFIAILPFPHPKARDIYRAHRMVVLPDFQGIGIGRRLLEETGTIYRENGKRFRITTSHPSLIGMLRKSPRWALGHQGRASAHSGSLTGSGSERKLTTSWEFIG